MSRSLNGSEGVRIGFWRRRSPPNPQKALLFVKGLEIDRRARPQIDMQTGSRFRARRAAFHRGDYHRRARPAPPAGGAASTSTRVLDAITSALAPASWTPTVFWIATGALSEPGTTVLLPTLAIAQPSQQLPQPTEPGQWCENHHAENSDHLVPSCGPSVAGLCAPRSTWQAAGARANKF